MTVNYVIYFLTKRNPGGASGQTQPMRLTRPEGATAAYGIHDGHKDLIGLTAAIVILSSC